MAKPKKTDSPSAGLRHTPLRRRLVGDERFMALVPVDHSTILVTTETVIHSNFQTRPPIVESDDREVDATLVGRFQYGPAHFRALTALVIRSFLIFEKVQGKSVSESAAFLKDKIDKSVARLENKLAKERD